jgi:hypothetical protein
VKQMSCFKRELYAPTKGVYSLVPPDFFGEFYLGYAFLSHPNVTEGLYLVLLQI